MDLAFHLAVTPRQRDGRGHRRCITKQSIAEAPNFWQTGSSTVTGLLLASAPGNGTNLPFQIVTMSFRIQRWSLKKDWSVQIEGQTVTDSMYDLDVRPKPMDVVPGPLPPLFYSIPLGPAWAPYQVQAAANDALFPGEWTFDTNQSYAQMAGGYSGGNFSPDPA